MADVVKKLCSNGKALALTLLLLVGMLLGGLVTADNGFNGIPITDGDRNGSSESRHLPSLGDVIEDVLKRELEKELRKNAADRPTTVNVPSVIGMPVESARAVLQDQWLQLGTISYSETTKAQAGIIIAQTPNPGGQAAKHSSINVTVAKAPPPQLRLSISPPSIIIKERIPAQFAAPSNITNVSLRWEGANQKGTGNTFSVDTQSLAPGNYTIKLTAMADSGVSDVTTARLSIYTKVPTLLNQTPDTAASLLAQAGLKPGKTSYEAVSSGQDSRVIKQQHHAGTYLAPGTSVSFVVSRLEQQPPPPPPRPEPLILSIDPAQVTSKQDEVLNFKAKTSHPGASFKWDLAGYGGSGKTFKINSKVLKTGKTYTLKLTASADGQTATARASIQVAKPAEPVAAPPVTPSPPTPAPVVEVPKPTVQPELPPPPASSSIAEPPQEQPAWLLWVATVLGSLGIGYLLAKIVHLTPPHHTQVPRVVIHYTKALGNQQTQFTSPPAEGHDLHIHLLPDLSGKQQVSLRKEMTDD